MSWMMIGMRMLFELKFAHGAGRWRKEILIRIRISEGRGFSLNFVNMGGMMVSDCNCIFNGRLVCGRFRLRLFVGLLVFVCFFARVFNHNGLVLCISVKSFE
jgi:hypothetical protein